MVTVMDDLIIMGLMFLRLGVPILMMALLAAALDRAARSSA